MTISKLTAALVCGMALALGACTETRRVGDPEALAAEQQKTAAAEAALTDLRASLAAAQAALRAANTGEQRTAARAAVNAAQEDLAQVQDTLEEQPPSAARTAADTALTAVGDALGAVAEALGAANAAFGSGGTVSFASMHTTLARAQAALDVAQTRIAEALAADPTGAIETLLSQAQGALTTAQVSLVPLLREELETAEADLAARTKERDDARAERDDALARLNLPFGKDLAIGGPEASRVSPADDAAVTLTPRRSGVEWSVANDFVATSPSWRVRTRYTIEDYGTASAARLDIAQDPVPYRADGGMVIPGASGDPATNEFPGRGEVFRGIGYDHREFQLPRQGSYGPASDGTAVRDIPRFPSGAGLRGNLRGHAVSSFQYREDGGLTMKFGGLPPDRKPDDAPEESKGSLIYGDLEALTATGRYDCGSGDEACDEAGARDLTVSFGAPSRDPLGDPVYHWAVDVPDPRLTTAAGAAASLDDAERADPDGVIGRYQMLLSNHAGVDDKGAEAAGDDGERYLRYAAYGLFQFIDYQTTNDRPGRLQTVHYGFDAFGGHNPLPEATADSIAATLKGRTMAWLATGERGTVAGLDRMRANITLHACIGGGGCQESAFTAPAGAAKPTEANELTGAIHDLEIELSGGAWGAGNTAAHESGHYAFSGDILLDGDVGPSGAFAGTLRPDTMPSDGQWTESGRTAGPDTHGYTIRQQGEEAGRTPATRGMDNHWAHGAFEGAFYGPADALEAAGTWWLPAVGADVTGKGVIGIVGSFGAKCDEGCD